MPECIKQLPSGVWVVGVTPGAPEPPVRSDGLCPHCEAPSCFKVDEVEATLVYGGRLGHVLPERKEYVLRVTGSGCQRCSLQFNWDEGNYSCDCNRSLFIRRHCDPDFPEFDCGETIKLASLAFIQRLEYEELC